jgi:hypothetical protein
MSHPSSTPDPPVSSPDPGTTPDADARLASPPDRSWVWLALVAGHFGAAVYVLFGVLSLVALGSAAADIPESGAEEIWPLAFGIMAAAFFAFAVLTEAATIGLHQRRKWAWFAAFALFTLWLLSLTLLPIGAMGMCGLLMGGSRREFGMG